MSSAISRFRRDTIGVDTHPDDTPDDTDLKPSRSPWEWIDLLTFEKMPLREAKRNFNFSSYNIRMINRALVGSDKTIDLVTMLNERKHLNTDPEAHYRFLYEFLEPVKHYCKWYFGKEDVDLAELRKQWCELHELGTSDFYSLLDNRYGVDRMLSDIEEAIGGKDGPKGRKKK